MPGWLTEVLKALGFTTPFIYAAATYGFFHWLDRKASGPAKKAISDWLEPREYDRAAVAAAILEVFDRVYTRPLLAWPAFRRSALITVCVTLLVAHTFDKRFYAMISVLFYNAEPLLGFIVTAFLVNIASDYIALFIVRGRLVDSRITPSLALIVAPALGVVFVLLCIFLRACIYVLVAMFIRDVHLDDIPDEMFDRTHVVWSIGALIVHLWLPFFALCIGLVKGLNYILLATKQVQWFLKRGKHHPLDALGLVATPLAFLMAVAVQILLSK
jgi:hypothetical protein